MIRVLVADDSTTVRRLLVEILGSDPEIEVVAEAANGAEALDLAVRLKPDLVTMDVQMPIMDGLEATKEIMVKAPTRIILVTSHDRQDQVALSLNATRAGALMVLNTPDSPHSPEFESRSRHLLSMVRAMAEVRVVRRWADHGEPEVTRPPRRSRAGRIRIVTVAGSTGGPAALQRILMDLPRTFPVPILVVQHIAPGFTEGLCSWLAANCNLRVKLAETEELLQPRTVYLAPDNRHLTCSSVGRINLPEDDEVAGFRPSASRLFASAAEIYGAATLAVILTGMGRDGVTGLQAVHAAGGKVLAQDERTSIVYGMPGEAVKAGVVDESLAISDIAGRIVSLVNS